MTRSDPMQGCLIAALLLISGCAAAPPVAIPEPELAIEEPAAEVIPEPVIPYDQRWREPFAVESSGRTIPREPRRVAIIGADPLIEAGLNALAADSAARPSVAPRTPGAVDEADARDDAPPPVAPDDSDDDVEAPRTPATHLVTRGETWIGIARRYGISTDALAEANPNVVPDRIRAGQRLELPGGGGTDSPAAVTHTVRTGETIATIARRYDVTVERIRSINNLENDRLRVGQLLIIVSDR